MRRRTIAAAIVAAATIAAAAAGQEAARYNGPEMDGIAVATDYPSARHQRNTVGTDGAGLCVFHSIEHAADWANVRQLDDLCEYMERHERGGGWPEKVDRILEARAPGLEYAHYLGSDPGPFLEAALRSGRMPCVTYGTGERYNGRTIAHMVNCVAFDTAAGKAAILDNNFPGEIAWMSTREFLRRFNHPGGQGWALVLFAPPPPPPPRH